MPLVSDLSLVLNGLLLLALLLFQRRIVCRDFKSWWTTWDERCPCRWQPQSPPDCPHCPLYYLKSSPKEVEFVRWFLAEGVDASVLVRFTGHAAPPWLAGSST